MERPIIYNRIKAVLAEKAVTNQTLGEALGLNKDSISAWCSQKKQPTWANLYAIADFLEVDVRELLVPNEKSPRKDFKF